MKKSISTRFAITRKGKAMRRKMAQCHFRAKKSGKQIMNKSGNRAAGAGMTKILVSKQGEL